MLVLALLIATSAFALDPARALTQARLSVWTSDSGLPQNTIGAMVQTRDGYLWIGTEEGLAAVRRRTDCAASGVVTASLGVSSSNGTAVTPLSLVADADAALYRAKSGGRDRVETTA